MPQKDAKRSYIDVMMENLDQAQSKGLSFADATAVSAMVKASWNQMLLIKLLDFLQQKGLMTHKERDELNNAVTLAMAELSDAAEVKYPLIAEALNIEKLQL